MDGLRWLELLHLSLYSTLLRTFSRTGCAPTRAPRGRFASNGSPPTGSYRGSSDFTLAPDYGLRCGRCTCLTANGSLD